MNQKGFAPLILILIIGALIAIAGGSMYFSGQSKSTKPNNEPAPEVQTTQQTSASGETSSAPVEQVNQNVAPKTLAQTTVPTKQVTAAPAATASPTPSAPDISCAIPTDTSHMDIFDSHVHIPSAFTASKMIGEMDKAGVSVANLYTDSSGSLAAISQYPGRFITFVDTPDSSPSWLTQGQSFLASAETQLKTGKFYGIGETNLRYYSGPTVVPPPTIYVAPDTPLWLELVDLSAKYNVPISFHFVPDDSTANAAFERMLSHNKDAVFIWAHLGFNNMTLDSATLTDYLLRYPHLYFDTAGIQSMQKSGYNWEHLMPNGQLDKDWKRFFETWNSRIMVASDAGGGSNGVDRWLNYSSSASDAAAPNSFGHWRSLFSYTDQNTARNILSGNARELFLKKQKTPYNYSVASNGKCYSISVNSESSVSALTFNQSTRTITFTVADSTATTGNAVVTIPTALAGTSFTASVDGQNVKSQVSSNSTNTTVSLNYSGGIKSITLSASSMQ